VLSSVLRTIAAALLSIQKKIKKNGTVSPLPPTFPLPHSYSFLFLYVLLGQQQPLLKKTKKQKNKKNKNADLYVLLGQQQQQKILYFLGQQENNITW